MSNAYLLYILLSGDGKVYEMFRATMLRGGRTGACMCVYVFMYMHMHVHVYYVM
jgi:hypothetical protein